MSTIDFNILNIGSAKWNKAMMLDDFRVGEAPGFSNFQLPAVENVREYMLWWLFLIMCGIILACRVLPREFQCRERNGPRPRAQIHERNDNLSI